MANCCLSFFKKIHLRPAIIGCVPLIYKIILYISYISLFPLCFVIFIEDNEKLEEITFIFLIYQMIVATLFFINGCYGLVKKQTTSEYLLEIESQRSLYQIDDYEMELLQTEIAEARQIFKGSTSI